MTPEQINLYYGYFAIAVSGTYTLIVAKRIHDHYRGPKNDK